MRIYPCPTGAGLAAACLALVLVSAPVAPVQAAPDQLVLSVQPILDPDKTRAAFLPLADYIGKAAGVPCTLRTYNNFLSYWQGTHQGGSDLVLDAAHFTDYRIQKRGYVVLAKIPDQVSYTLVARNDLLIVEPAELVGKRVATLGPPSLGAARLAAMFPHTTRQPIVVEANSSGEALEMVIGGKVHAAIVPTPLVAQRMAAGDPIEVVVQTTLVPHIALSAAPGVEPALRNKIRDALLGAAQTDAGRSMLQAIGFPGFDPATAAVYAGQGDILKTTWGY